MEHHNYHDAKRAHIGLNNRKELKKLDFANDRDYIIGDTGERTE